MTHNKLLVKLMVLGADESEQTRLSKTTQALRAVVELHKPMLWKNLGNDTDGYKCQVCEGNSYPCPTIQVIEKDIG